MHMSRCVSPSAALVSNTKPLVGALAAALLICSTAQAASFGHSRIVSALGQPLRIDIPIKQLSPDDLRTISVSAASASAWIQAGLIPPVDLASLQTRLADGFTAGSKVIQVRSDQPFDKPVADLLLDVRTASGRQRYQVSLLTHANPDAIRSSGAAGSAAGAMGNMASAGDRASQRTIRVRRNDTMFAIAKRNAVPGVTVYQMMIALQRANPQAFIENNVNLVKEGATLSMPAMSALTAISDREARRIFQQQAQAFALYRQRAAGQVAAVGQAGGGAKGVVSSAIAPDTHQPAPGPQDQLRLSGGEPATGAGRRGPAGQSVVPESNNPGDAANQGGTAAGGTRGQGQGSTAGSGSQYSSDVRADDRVATQKGIKDSEARVSQLEENVKHLNQALQAQGEAAKDLLVDGAKGLGLSLAGMAGTADTSAGNGSTAGGTQSSTDAKGAASGGNGAAGSIQSTQPTNAGSGPANRPDGRAGTGSNSGTGATGATGSNAVPGQSGEAAAQGTESSAARGAQSDANALAAGTSPAKAADPAASAAGANPPASSGSGPAGTSGGSSAAVAGAEGVQANPSKPGSATASGPDAANSGATESATTGADRKGDVPPSISNKAEQNVSWIQEHMLGVITGLLALIVLIIAWILRRANASHDHDGRDGVVTEAMVKEKLDQISLDFDQSDDPNTRKR